MLDEHPSEPQRTFGGLMKFSSEEEIAILKEAKLLASSDYERNTKWGEEASIYPPLMEHKVSL